MDVDEADESTVTRGPLRLRVRLRACLALLRRHRAHLRHPRPRGARRYRRVRLANQRLAVGGPAHEMRREPLEPPAHGTRFGCSADRQQVRHQTSSTSSCSTSHSSDLHRRGHDHAQFGCAATVVAINLPTDLGATTTREPTPLRGRHRIGLLDYQRLILNFWP